MGICFEKETKVENDQNQDKDESTSLPESAEQITLNNEFRTATVNDFNFVKVVGRGAFGKVMLVQYKMNKTYYAMKILRKDIIKFKNQELHTQNERKILEVVKHPFIVQLHFAFQSLSKLYLVTDFLVGGELFFHLRKAKKFTEIRTRLYVAELALALDYLHQKGIAYRDLKPENILLGSDGHIKLTDFGLSRMDLKEGERTYTFCGTPEYLAPEILLGHGHNQAADFWSLGALMYEMLAGAPPFYSQDKGLMFRNRLEKKIEMKPWFSTSAISLLEQLLNNDPTQRITMPEIKQHKFFDDLDWDDVFNKKIQPQFIPKITNDIDLQNIDPVFTDEQISDTPIQTLTVEKFDKFTYANSEFYKS